MTENPRLVPIRTNSFTHEPNPPARVRSPRSASNRRRSARRIGAGLVTTAATVALALSSTLAAAPAATAAPASPSKLLRAVGVPQNLAELADTDSLTVQAVDALPQTITGVSGSLGMPTTITNTVLSTVGGCQTGDTALIVACTESQTLTTEAPLLLRLNPATANIVVLGAGLFPDGSIRPVLEERLRAALTLANEYPAAPIIVTGGVPQSGKTEADAMHEWLVANGVPAGRITKEGASRSTVENADNTERILDERGAPATVVVTSPGHLTRSLVNFRQAAAGDRPVEGVIAP